MSNNNMSEVGGLVSETLVFTVSDETQARNAVDALKADGIGDDQIHLLSPGQNAGAMHSHEAPSLTASSVKTSRLRGAAVGGIVGVGVGLLLFLLAPVSGLMVLGAAVLGVGVGALGSQLIGVSEPNPAVVEAMRDVEKGSVAILVEVARSRHEHVVDVIHKVIPQADVKHESITGGVAHS